MTIKNRVIVIFKKFWKLKWLRIPVLTFLFLYLCFQYNFLWLMGSMPSVEELKDPKLPVASELYAANGELIGKYFHENRTNVEIKDVNPLFYKGLVATEDVRFYEHNGIDWQANVSIFYYMLKGDKRGASTISQQLAKNLFKIRKSNRGLLSYIPGIRTLNIKVKEWTVARRLESNYSKNDILLLYMNTVDFGSNAFGIKTAAKTYFNKHPKQLTADEAAILIGLLKATTTYSPVLHPDKSLERRNVVLSLMKKHGVINDSEFKEAVKKPIRLNFHVEKPQDSKLPYVRSAVAREISQWCSENGYDIYTDGLRIYSTIDMELQAKAELAVAEHMKSLQKRFDNHWAGQNPWVDADKVEIPNFLETNIKQTDAYRNLKKRFGNDEEKIFYHLNKPNSRIIYTHDGYVTMDISSMDSLAHYKKMLRCGFYTIDPHTGHIKSYVGGWNHDVIEYDHIVQSKRQPGSTFKPFVYATAFEQGNGPCDTRVDKYIRHEYEENGEIQVWEPKNANRVFTNEPITLRQAMAMSINSIAVQLTLECGPKNVANTAKKLGVNSPLQPVPSIGLGTNDVSLWELTASYAPFINGGYKIEPILVTKITDRKGKVLAKFKQKKIRVLSPETAWLMSYMFKGTIEEYQGTSQALFQYQNLVYKNDVGGKTGTSNNYSDGWYIGITSGLIGGVWVGAEDRSVHFKTSATGEAIRTALPIYGLFMEKVLTDHNSSIKASYYPKEPMPIEKPHNCRGNTSRKLSISLIDSLEYLPEFVDTTVVELE